MSIANRWIKDFDNQVGKRGIQKALMDLLSSHGVKLLTKGKSKKIKNMLRNEPTVVVSNHPMDTDILVMLAGLESRMDNFVVGNSVLMSLGENISKHVIPVYISHNFKDENSLRMRVLSRFFKKDTTDHQQSHKNNIKNIALASKKIDEGGVVVICPSPGSKNGRWFDGIGYLIKNLKFPDKVNVVKIKVGNTSDIDYFRFLPFINKILPPFKITFAKPVFASKFIDKNPKIITKIMELDYKKWFLTI